MIIHMQSLYYKIHISLHHAHAYYNCKEGAIENLFCLLLVLQKCHS